MTRRDLLRWIGLGALAGAAAPLRAQRGGALAASAGPFVPDVELALTAAPGEARILAGAPTRVWAFTGSVLKGPAATLQTLPGSYLGPVIRLKRGQKVRIRFRNGLPESSIVHWHGLDVPAAMDGHPHAVIAEGAEFIYEFEVANRAGTYWYHPHPHNRTGPQVYSGLAGMLIVSDDEEQALGLPSGTEEIVWVLQDRRFDSGNQLRYLGGGMMPMMDAMRGFLGDRVLVNGQPPPALSLATRAYRLRLLNGSNARVYKLTWSDQTPIAVIGTDGGLLERPRQQAYVTLAPGQRADVILDLTGRSVGTSLQLRSAAFPSTDVDRAGMMGGGMMGAAALPQGSPLLLATLTVARREPSVFRMPTRLVTFDDAWTRRAGERPRRVPLSFQFGAWQLGGRTFDMHEAAADETVPAGSTRIWELANVGGMMGMQMAHPIHLHGRQFRVLDRTGATPPTALHEGLVDAGWTDTVLVMPGETVRILVTFTQHPGLYLYHCHILEHEDMGMMRNFRVTAAEAVTGRR